MAFNPLELATAVVTWEGAIKGVTKAISMLYGQEIETLLASVKAAGAQGTPINHDLERGIRLAQITASLVVVIAYAKEDEKDRADTRGVPPDPFIAPALAFLRGQAGLCAGLSVTPNNELVALLETGLNAALSEAGRGVESATTRTHRQIAEQEVWAELLAGAPGAMPRDALRRRFFGEEGEEPGWFACFIAFFREALKDNPKIRVPFFVGRIAEILGQQRATLALLGRLRGEAAEGFDRIETKLDRNETEAERRHREVMEAIIGKSHVPIRLLEDVLRKLGEAEVSAEAIPARLEAWAERFLEMNARLSEPSNDRPETAAARERARKLLDAGDLDGAEAALRDARGALRERREQTAREEAALLGDEAGIAQLRLDYAAEAKLHREAARLLDFDIEAAWAAWMRVAEALYRNGLEFGDRVALRGAVGALETEALRRAPADRRPLDCARTNDTLGNVLFTLGQRGEDGALERAITAYESALTLLPQETAAVERASVRNNLGNVLRTLGQRGDERALERAVEIHKETLRELTQESAPRAWATAQNSLGLVLAKLGQRGDGHALAGAVEAYENALKVFTQKSYPREWAMTQTTLGIALTILGDHGDDKALARAISSFENALLERTQSRASFDCAIIQHNLGDALAILARRGDEGALAKAMHAYKDALLVRTRERAPLQWAITTSKIGLAYLTHDERGDGDALENAVNAFEGALSELTYDRSPLDWANTQEHLARAELALGDRGAGSTMWRKALARVEEALAEYRSRKTYNSESAEHLAAQLRARLTPPE